jgi:hypothetical protein
LVIHQEDIVNNFTNSEIKFADEPANLNCMFEPTVTAVSDLLSHHSDLRTQLQPALLGGQYEPNLVGIYSKFHDSASYVHGYGSDEAWRLAYMCVTIIPWSALSHVAVCANPTSGSARSSMVRSQVCWWHQGSNPWTTRCTVT